MTHHRVPSHPTHGQGDFFLLFFSRAIAISFLYFPRARSWEVFLSICWVMTRVYLPPMRVACAFRAGVDFFDFFLCPFGKGKGHEKWYDES